MTGTQTQKVKNKPPKSELQQRYNDFKARKLNLDMTRGKPCPEQLDLSLDMLSCTDSSCYISEDGTDCRNYGGLDGIPEAKRLFAEYLNVAETEIIIGGNSSLNMMHDTIMRGILFGFPDSPIPWKNLTKIKFLCPSPGYDRHFAVLEYFGIEMITIDMTEHGPDMDQVESLVKSDAQIKGIWCVPRYSNPTGITYSDGTISRLAEMQTQAPDFTLFVDNAYAVHHLTDTPDPLADILDACKKAGYPNRTVVFGSTSKISLAGSGVAFMASSLENINYFKKLASYQTIGPDKINQLRHVRFFKNLDGLMAQMKKHAMILKPKFDMVRSILEQELGGLGLATWSKPKGGYFISIDTQEGKASQVVRLASEAGVKLTPAGSTFPYGKDPKDRNIRLAPSFPSIGDIRTAMELLCVCIMLPD